jgi:hypothetical protein
MPGQLTTRDEVLLRILQGKSLFANDFYRASTSTQTAAATNNGGLNAQLMFPNNQWANSPPAGTGIQLNAGTDTFRLVNIAVGTNSTTRGVFVCCAYRFGTLALNATGDKLTRDSWTGPVNRTQFGVSTPITGWPIFICTTTETTTAPIFTISNVAANAGYKSQDGTVKVGTRTHTLTTTFAAGTGLMLMVEDGDVSVRDITNVRCTTAGAVCAGEVWMIEPLFPVYSVSSGETSIGDALFRTLALPPIRLGTPTSGSFTRAFPALCSFGSNTTTSQATAMMTFVKDA